MHFYASEPLIYLIRWGLLVLGMIYFVTESMFFSPFRVKLARQNVFFELLIYCAACSGFWIGSIIGWCGLWPLYPYDSPISALGSAVQSGIAAMAVGALWAHFHPNAVRDMEMELLDELLAADANKPENDDTKSESEDGQ